MLVLLFMLSVSSECGAQFFVFGPPHRAPVRRSPMEALERLRYFPQVDYAEEGGAYALPPQWTDPALYNDEPEDEGEYEYEAQPLYRTPLETYPEQQLPEAPLASYGDLVRGYLAGPPPPPVFLQRRSDSPLPPASTQTPPPQPSSSSSSSPPLVQSLVLPDPPLPQSSGGPGQKEEPLFRPLHTSQRTTNWNQKSPIPMLKQMIQGAQKKKEQDPLLEELSNLKKV